MPILRVVVLRDEIAVAGQRRHRGEITCGLRRRIAEGGKSKEDVSTLRLSHAPVSSLSTCACIMAETRQITFSAATKVDLREASMVRSKNGSV